MGGLDGEGPVAGADEIREKRHTMTVTMTELGPAIDELIERALGEDLASGDVTSRCTVPPGTTSSAELIARQSLVFCGGEVARAVFERVDARSEAELVLAEGARAEVGDVCMRVRGAARSLLAAERVALNLLQRACGVATLTAAYVAAAGDGLRVTDTRKTMPGMRALDRYAVRSGGGFNHRNDLGAGVLIKENHIRAAGSLAAAVRGAVRGAPHGMRVECEVTNLDELREAIMAGAGAVLLDNMDDARVAEALAVIRELEDRQGAGHGGRGGIITEVSGGITLERLPRLAGLGVDLVSVGALTHSVPAADLSLLFDRASE